MGNFKKKIYFYRWKNRSIKNMSTFIGKYDAKADVKGRIFIPSVYRKVLPDGEKDRLVMRKDADNDCLILFPESVWNKKIAETLNFSYLISC